MGVFSVDLETKLMREMMSNFSIRIVGQHYQVAKEGNFKYWIMSTICGEVASIPTKQLNSFKWNLVGIFLKLG